MNNRDRFLAVMEYRPFDRVPNHELGVWGQTIERWSSEGMPSSTLGFDWFVGEDYFNFDRREFIDVNFNMMPAFEPEVIERTDRHEVIRHSDGIVRRALIEGTVGGTRSCMDQFLRFPVETREDFEDLKKRYVAAIPERYVQGWQEEQLPEWKRCEHPLILGRNCAAGGFYWRARQWMGTENLSYTWYDQPELAHDMMEFYADFTIETARPILEEIDVEYFNLSEDFAMKTGPLLSPDTFRKFVFKPMKRLVEFFKSRGTRYVTLDSDGNPEALIPLLMDAGIDMIWPLERASDMNPLRIRQTFGKSLRLSGGVDKREIARGPKAIDAHLRELIPLVEEGGFIPTVDHTVPPDVSWENFCYYMDAKQRLLEGRL